MDVEITPHETARPRLAPAYLGYALALLCAVNIVNYMDRSVVGVLIEPMRAELHLSDTQIGLMTGFAFALFYATGGIYLAHLADTGNRSRLIALSILTWSVMTALTGAAQNFWQLMLARVGVGVGEAGVIPAANALLTDSHAPCRRPLALAFFTSGSMIGVMAGAIAGGMLASAYGWRWAFGLTGIVGLPLALLVWFTLHDPVRGEADIGVRTDTVPFVVAMRDILSNRALMWLILGYAFLVFMLFGVITWFPALVVRMHGLALTEVGVRFGVALGLGTALGAIGGGAAAGWLTARDQAWLTRLPLLSMLILGPLYQAAIFAPSPALSLTLVAIVSAVGGTALGPSLAAMQAVLPATMRAKGAAFNGFVGSLIGIGGAPLLVGTVSDHFAASLGSAHALQRGLAVAVMVGWAGTLLMALAHRHFTTLIRARGERAMPRMAAST